MSSKRTVQFKIYRYDPDKDDKPYMQDISVELEESDKKLLGCAGAFEGQGRLAVLPSLLP